MKIKSQLVTQMSGSLGGITGSHNKGGLYLRARSIPVNPNSAAQQAVRNALSSLVNLWTGTLTAAKRAAWETYAANVPKTDTLGDTLQLSGQQWYIGANVPRLQASLARVDDAPTVFNRGNTDETIAITASEATQLMSVAFDDTLPWADEDGSSLLVYASRPQNASINYFKGPYRFAGQIDGDSGTPPTSPTTIAVPFPVVAGQQIFVATAITRADGRLTSRQRFPVAVAA